MSTHTPGPWHVGPHYKSDVESRHGRICECVPMNTKHAYANANLIAAAPELLYVAHRVAAHFEGTDSPLAMAAREAIAKAEGRNT